MYLMFTVMFRLWEKSPKQKIEQMISRGETQKAFVELSQIIDEANSFDPFLLEMRARCAMLLSMTTTAIFDLSKLLIFKKLAQIEKDHLLAVRAAAYLRIGDYENALKDGQRAFSNKKFSYNLQALHEMVDEANFLINQQNITEKSITRLLSISPESKVVLFKASKFYLQNKKFDEFDKFSQLLLKYDPANSEILMHRSKYLMCQANNFDESLNMLSSCSNDCHELQNNYTHLINFFNSVRDGNYSQIESLLNKSNEVVNSICEKGSNLKKFIKFINMSLIYKQNKLENAYDIVNQIIREDPQDINAIISKADILFDAGNYESALKTYQQSLMLINLYNIENNYRIQRKISVCEHILEKQKSLSPFTILGISDDSNLSTAQSAYKKLSKEWDTENFESSLYKEIAESKMKQINSSFQQILVQLSNQKYTYEDKANDLPKYSFDRRSSQNIYCSKIINHRFISHRF